MSVKYFCDLCLAEVPNQDRLTQTTPGSIGTKSLCKTCYAKWIETVKAFFKQGSA